MKKIIHVHQHRLRQGKPPIIVRTYKGVEYAAKVSLKDKDGNVVAIIEYNEKPLNCGARVWMTTSLEVEKQ